MAACEEFVGWKQGKFGTTPFFFLIQAEVPSQNITNESISCRMHQWFSKFTLCQLQLNINIQQQQTNLHKQLLEHTLSELH